VYISHWSISKPVFVCNITAGFPITLKRIEKKKKKKKAKKEKAQNGPV